MGNSKSPSSFAKNKSPTNLVQQNTPKLMDKDYKISVDKKGLSNTIDFKRNNELNNTTSNSHANTEKKLKNNSETEFNRPEDKEKLFKKNVKIFNPGNQIQDIDFKSVKSNLNGTSQSFAINDISMDNRSTTKSIGKKSAKPPKRNKTKDTVKLKPGKAEVITTIKQKTNFNVKKPKMNVGPVVQQKPKNTKEILVNLRVDKGRGRYQEIIQAVIFILT